MLCWAQLSCKQLGVTPGQDGVSSEATHYDRLLKHGKIRHICCGDGFTVFVFENGKIFYSMNSQRQRKPGCIDGIKERIHFVACESSLVHFITEGGNVFSCSLKANLGKTSKEFPLTKPEILKSLSQRHVIQVSCGKDHSLALCREGQLVAWGQNAHGQLGLGKEGGSQSNPQCLKSLTGIPMAHISAGGAHSFALSVSGAVFGWGRNDHGQLGLNDTDDRHKPMYVKSLEGKKTVYISCGEEHTAVLTKGGLVFTFGAGSFGQLGHNKTRDEINPRLVAESFVTKVSQIACGSYHTLMFVPSSGKLYSFGRGEKGQLGNGQTNDQLVPLPVKLASHTPDTEPASDCEIQPAIRRIFAGGNQSFVDCFEEEVQGESEPVCSASQASFATLKKIATIDHFLSEQFQTDYKKLRRKKVIQRLFASPQSLNGSFLNSSRDKHFKTGKEESGLDMSTVHLGFQKLAENSAFLEQAIDKVKNCLIPSLPKSLAAVEGLRVYLILPELVSVLEEEASEITELMGLLSRSILLLGKDQFELLESWWRILPVHHFKKLVKLYQSSSQHLIEMNISVQNSDPFDCLVILQALYKVNCSRDSKIPENDFHIPLMEIIRPTILIQANNFPPIVQFSVPSYQMLQKIMHYPCMFDLEAKVSVLQMESTIFKLESAQQEVTLWGPNNLQNKLNCLNFRKVTHFRIEYTAAPLQSPRQTPLWVVVPPLQVTRKQILQSTLERLSYYKVTDHQLEFTVQFTGESCFGPGVSQEFFSLFTQALYESEEIFMSIPESGLLWFPNQELECDDVFRKVGILFGIALQNSFIANFRFPLALYKKLLNVQPTLEDLKDLFPTEGCSLQKLLDYRYDDIEDVFCLDFTILRKTNDGPPVVHELIPNGKETPVQKHNRKQFVDVYVDYVFNTSVKKYFKAFANGFRSSFPLYIVNIFQPFELMAIVHGDSRCEWGMLKKNASYREYKPNDKTIKNFWKVFYQLSEEEKKKFLVFLTGSERIPVGVIGTLKIIICRTECDEPDFCYPRAFTCSNTLQLPNYSSLQKLKEKLLVGIEQKEFSAAPP